MSGNTTTGIPFANNLHAAAPLRPLLAIRNLDVRFSTSTGEVHAVKALDLDIARGETLALVGESGSGKSQTMLAVMGLIAANGRTTGSATFEGTELIGASVAALNRLRGTRLAMIFQEPMTSLDPLVSIGDQIAAPLLVHRRLDRAAVRARTLELLREVEIRDPERRIDAYPHELSGGQRQRVMIAMALANDPDLLIADEPTTALDVTVQARILALLDSLKQRRALSLVFITHDLALVRRLADRTAVMQRGAIVEIAPTSELFATPRHDYTRYLLRPVPAQRRTPLSASAPLVLEGRGLRVAFPSSSMLKRQEFVALDGIDIAIRQGETVGVVGESGSGKTTLGRALLRLVPSSGTIEFGDARFDQLDRTALRPLRRDAQIVFQDPFGSLSPRLTCGEIIAEGLRVHVPRLTRADREHNVARMLEDLQLDSATAGRFPQELSGGQRQRIAIGRAMILEPKFVVLDEPTSALDRSVQHEIVELLARLQRKLGTAYLFISHDLALVRALADRILVMQAGRIVEEGSARQMIESPQMDYTRLLVASAHLD